MATRAREGGACGGGGGGGRANSSQPKKAAAAQPPKPQKPLPNYLRPTISSSLDFSSSRASRRSNPDTKPPSPAHLRKALHSTTTALRPKSSTAATRTPPSIKPAPQRSFSSLSSSSTKAPAGPSTWRSSSAKASPANSSTSVNRVGRKAGPRSATSESSVDFDARDKDPSDHVIVQGEKLDAPAATVELDTVAKDAKNEDVIVAEEGELLLQEAAPCEKEQHPVGPEEERSIGKSNEEIETEDREKDEHPVVTGEEERSNEEMETEDRVNQGNGEEDSTKVDEKHVVVELEGSVEGSKVREDTSVEVVQVKIESPTVVKVERPAKQTQSRKKETQAYNDVIEETASKLMGSKRNKVRALAGAFETVISLQDTK